MNLTDLIGQQARVAPAADAIVHDGGVISFAELDALVTRFAARLAQAGVEPGRLVGVSLDAGPMTLVMALALARMGAVSVPLSPQRPAAWRTGECAQFGVAAVVAEDARLAIEGRGFVLFDPDWMHDPAGAAPASDSFSKPQWPWRLHISSGTTSRRLKAVLESHASLIYNVVMYQAAGLAAPGQRFVLGLPLTIASGIRPTLRVLMSGIPVILPRSQATGDIIEAIERHDATDMLLSQGAVREMLATLPRGRVRFPKARRLVVGGFATPPDLIDAIVERIAPDLVVSYGASEIGAIAMADLADLRRAPGTVGRPVPGVVVQIVDEDDRPVPCGEVGNVRVRGPALPERYFRDPETSKKVFRNGWVYPGDFGRYGPGGYLWVESRVDDVIKVAGNLIDLAQVDRVLAEHPRVREAAAATVVTASGETRVIAGVVAQEGLDETSLLAHCLQRLGRLAAPKLVLKIDALPRNESGKVMRHELARRWKDAAGE